VGSFLPTVTFYALKVQKTLIWQRVAGAPPWGLRQNRNFKGVTLRHQALYCNF